MAKILVIEDDAALGPVIRRIAELEGHSVTWCDDGLRGLASAQRQRPDAIVLDLMMPVMDGFTVLEHLRADERTQNVPVIVLTAMALDDVRGRCEAAGVSRFLTKPFEPDHLTSVLAELALAA